jgi:hypothetical protein
MKTKTKVWRGCSLSFSITIGKEDIPESLINAGNYTEISKEALKIIISDKLGHGESIEEQIMDVVLVEFEKHPNEDDIQKEFKHRGLLFPEHIDALRFGAKYHEMGTLLNRSSRCCVMFPHETLPNTRHIQRLLAINYYNGERYLIEGGYGTKWDERWFFAGLRPHKKE